MEDTLSSASRRHVLDKSHIKLTYVTHFYFNQASIDTVTNLLKKYESYPIDLIKQIEFVIVDDASTIEYEAPKYSLNITWLRINEDLPWNHTGARNLGVVYAKSDKVVITDIDHEFPAETLQYLVDAPHPGQRIYKFARIDNATQTFMRRHEATFFLSRGRFLRHFGYDEEFAGHYGHTDYQLFRYHKYHGSKLCNLPQRYLCRKRIIDSEKSYHSLARDDWSYNHLLIKRKKQEMDVYGAEHGKSRIFLNFTWQLIYQNSLEPPIQPVQRYWRYFWWFRRLVVRG